MKAQQQFTTWILLSSSYFTPSTLFSSPCFQSTALQHFKPKNSPKHLHNHPSIQWLRSVHSPTPSATSLPSNHRNDFEIWFYFLNLPHDKSAGRRKGKVEIASVCNINLILLIFSTPTTWNLNQTTTTFVGVRKERKKLEATREGERKRNEKVSSLMCVVPSQTRRFTFWGIFLVRLVRVARRSSVWIHLIRRMFFLTFSRNYPCSADFLFNYANFARSKKDQ